MCLGQLLLLFVFFFATSDGVRCILGNRLGKYSMVDSLYQCRFAIMLQEKNTTTFQLIGYPYQVNERGGCFFHPLGMITCDCFESYCNYRFDKMIERIEQFKEKNQKMTDIATLEKIVKRMKQANEMVSKEKDRPMWRKHERVAQKFDRKFEDFKHVRFYRFLIGFGFFLVFFIIGCGFEIHRQRRKEKNS